MVNLFPHSLKSFSDHSKRFPFVSEESSFSDFSNTESIFECVDIIQSAYEYNKSKSYYIPKSTSNIIEKLNAVDLIRSLERGTIEIQGYVDTFNKKKESFRKEFYSRINEETNILQELIIYSDQACHKIFDLQPRMMLPFPDAKDFHSSIEKIYTSFYINFILEESLVDTLYYFLHQEFSEGMYFTDQDYFEFEAYQIAKQIEKPLNYAFAVANNIGKTEKTFSKDDIERELIMLISDFAKKDNDFKFFEIKAC